MLSYLIIAGFALGIPTLAAAIKFPDVRKFLSGAFFVSSGVQFYLYLANVSVPLIGTSAVQHPNTSAFRAAVHFVMFVVCTYFGFFRAAKLSKYSGD